MRTYYSTDYSIAANSVSTSKYCLDIIANYEETNGKDYRDDMTKIFVEAACKGQVGILELANHFDISYFWKKSNHESQLLCRPIEKIAELGHLNVLQFLHDKFNMRFALPMASRGAAFGGQIHILKWLKANHILYDLKDNGQKDTLCYFALAGGQLETLQWLLQEGFELSERLIPHISGMHPFVLGNMATAIKTENFELIKYCKDQGFSFRIRSHHESEDCECLALRTGNIDLMRYCSEIGLEFTTRILEYAYKYITVDSLKFLRSKSLPWTPETIDNAVSENQYEVLKYAYENGCEWSQDTWLCCIHQKPCINWDIVHYLYEKSCPWQPRIYMNVINNATDRLRILEFIFSKKLPLSEKVLLECIHYSWIEETKLIVENTDVKNLPDSLTYIVKTTNCDFETLKYFHSKGIPFTETFLRGISSLAVQSQHEILIWALENGCPIEDMEDFYTVVQCAQFYKKEWLDLILHDRKFPGLEHLLVERVIKDQLYFEGFGLKSEGFGLKEFKLFLDHGCLLSDNVVKTIYKHWLINQCKDLDEIVAFISSSKHSGLSVDKLYMDYEESLDSADSDDDEYHGWDDEDRDLAYLPRFSF